MSWGISWLGSWGDSWGDGVEVHDSTALVPAGLNPSIKFIVSRAAEVAAVACVARVFYGSCETVGRFKAPPTVVGDAEALPVSTRVRSYRVRATGACSAGSRPRRVSPQVGKCRPVASGAFSVSNVSAAVRSGMLTGSGAGTHSLRAKRLSTVVGSTGATGVISLSEEELIFLYAQLRKRRR